MDKVTLMLRCSLCFVARAMRATLCYMLLLPLLDIDISLMLSRALRSPLPRDIDAAAAMIYASHAAAAALPCRFRHT